MLDTDIIGYSLMQTESEQLYVFFFFFQAEDGIRDLTVTGVQTCALPILGNGRGSGRPRCAHSGVVRVGVWLPHCTAEARRGRSEEHTSELQSQSNLVCRLLLEKKKIRQAQARQVTTTRPPVATTASKTAP